jgi:hypothetical protein
MSTSQLQRIIVDKVLTTEDEILLKSILEFFKNKPKTSTKKKINIGDPEHPYYNKLRPSEIAGVSEAMESYEKGEYEVMKTTADIENFVNSLV